jgi:hypothetical protein
MTAVLPERYLRHYTTTSQHLLSSNKIDKAAYHCVPWARTVPEKATARTEAETRNRVILTAGVLD